MKKYSEEEKKAGTRASGFKKFDTKKIDLTFAPAELIESVSKVMAFGAKKYGRDNWKKCENPNDYIAATLRHLYAILKGEEIDSETGFAHIDHAACCIAFLVWMQRKKEEKTNA